MCRKLSVLCIEDDPAELEALREYADILDWSVTFARNRCEGLDRARHHDFDVILAKEHLPDGFGVDIIKEIRTTSGPNRATPVVLSSCTLSERSTQDARALEIDAIVRQPMLLTTFKSSLQRLANRER